MPRFLVFVCRRTRAVALAAVAALAISSQLLLLTVGAAEPERFVIYINWDGFRRDYFDWAVAPGGPGAPNLEGLVSQGAYFPNAYTGVPSVTTAMQTSALTGAWPETHGNVGRHYDAATNMVKVSGRFNNVETVAEAAAKAGLSTASVQQFVLQGRADTYVQPGGRFERRVAEALKIIESGMPEFLAIYGDDLDAAGHNGLGYGTLPSLAEPSWRRKMASELSRMDRALGTLLDGLRKLGIFERTTIILTSDHGMTPYWGRSSMPELLSQFSRAGLKAEVLDMDDQPSSATDAIILSTGMAVQVYFLHEMDRARLDALAASIAAQPYVGGVLTRDELDHLGTSPLSGDMLVWPEPPHHFSAKDVLFGVGANHDGRHRSSTNVFMVLSGAGIRQGVVIEEPTPIIDVVPTISYLLGIAPPAGATGRVLWSALSSSANPGGPLTYGVDSER